MKLFLSIICLFAVSVDLIQTQDFENAIKESIIAVQKYKSDEFIPGLVIGINYKGKHVWVNSFGLSDVENEVPMRTDTVLRTGSVTKAIETTLVAKLVEESKIVWDSDIHQYISEELFPTKQWEGKAVNITVRQLMSMTGGIRDLDTKRDFLHRIRDCHNATDTLAYFSADPLVAKPGAQFRYSNWGWHLIGAIMESVTNRDYEVIMHEMFKEFHLNSTRLSRREAIIPHRCRPYTRQRTPDNKNWILKSAAVIEDLGQPLPWLPMGGVITSVPDLLTFTDIMIKSYKNGGYLKSATVRELWTPRLSGYGMGWYVSKYTDPKTNVADKQYIHYSGSVTGSVNTVAMVPELDISVAMIANMGGISMESIALSVLNRFVEVII